MKGYDLGLCQQWPPSIKPRIGQTCSPRHGQAWTTTGLLSQGQTVFAAKHTFLVRDHNKGCLQTWHIPKTKAERGWPVQVSILNSLYWGDGGEEQRRDQNSLANGCPKHRGKKAIPFPILLPSRPSTGHHFSPFLPLWHTHQVRFTPNTH